MNKKLWDRFCDTLIEWGKRDPGPHAKGFMRRYFIYRSKYFCVVVHNIRKEDPAGIYGLHNHPYHFLSLVLRGSYKEILLRNGKQTEIVRKPGDVCVRFKKDFHTVIPHEGNPVWTLFFRLGDAYGEWGLLDKNGKNYKSMHEAASEKIIIRIKK